MSEAYTHIPRSDSSWCMTEREAYEAAAESLRKQIECMKEEAHRANTELGRVEKQLRRLA